MSRNARDSIRCLIFGRKIIRLTFPYQVLSKSIKSQQGGRGWAKAETVYNKNLAFLFLKERK